MATSSEARPPFSTTGRVSSGRSHRTLVFATTPASPAAARKPGCVGSSRAAAVATTAATSADRTMAVPEKPPRRRRGGDATAPRRAERGPPKRQLRRYGRVVDAAIARAATTPPRARAERFDAAPRLRGV